MILLLWLQLTLKKCIINLILINKKEEESSFKPPQQQKQQQQQQKIIHFLINRCLPQKVYLREIKNKVS